MAWVFERSSSERKCHDINQARFAFGVGCRVGGSCAPKLSALASSFSLIKGKSARRHPTILYRN